MKRVFLISLLFFSIQSAYATQMVSRIMDKMTDEQKAAQLILVYYTTPEFVAEHEFGGVLIMQNMLKDPQKLKNGISKLQSFSRIGVLVSIDQEGGRVSRMKLLPGWKKVPSAREMSKWSDDRITEHAGKMAKALQALGINLNLAPVLDPSATYAGETAFMAQKQRSFGTGIDQIVSKADAYITGFLKYGIGSVSKHFPGYDVQTNSDHEVAISQASFEMVLENTTPFQRLASKVEGVMISSIIYEKFTSEPAVMSDRLVQTARQIHPDSILITDDLWGEALRSWISKNRKMTQNEQVLGLTRIALDVGNDMLMITYPAKAILMKKAISRWMQENETFRSRVEDAVYRILTMKEKMGLIQEQMPVTQILSQKSEKSAKFP